MPNPHKEAFLTDLKNRFGAIQQLPGSQSLFSIGRGGTKIYIRYSRVHGTGKTFFGLRDIDLRKLEGGNAFVCFLLNNESPPIIVPFASFEDVICGASPANDGQHKVQIILRNQSLELHVPRRGRFNVDAYVGFDQLTRAMEHEPRDGNQILTHSQVQSLLASIGSIKGYDVFVPPVDASTMDWSLTSEVLLRESLPPVLAESEYSLMEIDVIWLRRGANTLEGLFEVEHSTPVYSGLLRLNDALISQRSIARLAIVSNNARRSLFVRQISRPTFRASGLAERVSFLEYDNVWSWHRRLTTAER